MSLQKVCVNNKQNCESNNKAASTVKEICDKNKNIHNICNSDKYAEEGLHMILKNNLEEALYLFNKALSFDPNNMRHSLNRCYCYLRMNMNSLALADAEFVIHNSINNGYLFMARLRAGQALLALEKYRQAEVYLKQATEKYPEFQCAKRELMRVKVAWIVNMGFKEKDALLALEKFPITLEAINYLSDHHLTFSDSKYEDDFDTDCRAEDIIYSSDEDEKPNNIEIVNRILNYKPGSRKMQHILPEFKFSKSSVRFSTTSNLASPDFKRNGETKFTDKDYSQSHQKNGFIKNIKLNSPSLLKSDLKKNLKNTTNCNDYAIWVGSLTDRITDTMLEDKLSQFGTIHHIYRPYLDANTNTNAAYAFVYFEDSKAVSEALKYPNLKVEGTKLKISSAYKKST